MLKPLRNPPKSWSSTLSLPKSKFPPRALVADRPQYLKKCTDDLYIWQKCQRERGKGFTLQDGPPYANGDLHVGHALNKILKDITCRFQLSQGKNITFIPGWDCHGLPIELRALQNQKDLGVLRHDERPGPEFVRQVARELATKTVEQQKKSFREWAIMADWENAWKTMDAWFELDQLKVLAKLVKKGLIYRRFKPVYWSPSSRTALAEAELEYKNDHKSMAAFVKYPLNATPRKLQQLFETLGLGERTINAIIWTTTPWTLPANKAIGIHSGIEYIGVESRNHEILLVAKSRVAELQAVCGETLQTLFHVLGSELIGATYQDCGFTRASVIRPLLHANFVSTETGSGLVHLAPGHGLDDYELCLKHEIPAFAPVDDAGRFTSLASPAHPEILCGKEVLTSGNRAVLDFLSERGSLLARHRYTHKYPYDWRLKQPIILRATEQWFANVRGIREGAMQSLDVVNFIPKTGKGRLQNYIENRSEWCISRQRAWGLPIPALYHNSTGEALLTESSVSHIVSTIQDRGIDAWWTDDEQESSWLPAWLTDENGQIPYSRGKDTMDVWFDSGTSWTQTQGQSKSAKSHVADLYLEGTDQHRGWFQSSLLTYTAQQGVVQNMPPEAPFRTLITHGFVLDKKGRKMSKSIGNVISPEEIMNGTLLPPLKRKHIANGPGDTDNKGVFDSLGPDALRVWAASCDYTKDVVVSQIVLKTVNICLSKYRVTFKLLLGMLEDYVPSTAIPFLELDINHQIALLQLQDVEANVRKYYANFEFNKAVGEINKYVNTDFSAFYMETIKDAVYAGCKRGPTFSSRQMAQYTLLRVYSSIQQMLAPVTPLLIEETWAYTPSHIRDWLEYPFHRIWKERNGTNDGYDVSWRNDQLTTDLPYLLQANTAVKRAQERARNDKKMGSSLQSFVVLQFNENPENVGNIKHLAFDLLSRYRGDLETIFVASRVEICVGNVPLTVANAEWSYKDGFDIRGSKVSVHVYSPQKAKCVRCWKYAAPQEACGHISLCDRCEEVVAELRDQRPDLFEEPRESDIPATSA